MLKDATEQECDWLPAFRVEKIVLHFGSKINCTLVSWLQSNELVCAAEFDTCVEDCTAAAACAAPAANEATESLLQEEKEEEEKEEGEEKKERRRVWMQHAMAVP